MVQNQPPDVFYKKVVLKNSAKFTGKHPYQSLFSNKTAGLKHFQMISYEFYEIFKKSFFTEHLRASASDGL